jgi:hypothetical protein
MALFGIKKKKKVRRWRRRVFGHAATRYSGVGVRDWG